MKPELKAKWVEALRSGAYMQGKAKLRTYLSNKETPRFCCLGVLLDVSQEGQWTPGGNWRPNFAKGSLTASLGLQGCEYFDLDQEVHDKLIEFNDTKGKSFKWIAYYIERYVK